MHCNWWVPLNIHVPCKTCLNRGYFDTSIVCHKCEPYVKTYMYIYYIYFNISCLYVFVSFCFSRATRKHFLLVGYLINMFKLNVNQLAQPNKNTCVYVFNMSLLDVG